MAFTTADLLNDLMSANYSTTVDLVSADVTAHITRADGMILDKTGGVFLPFNAIDSTNGFTTPSTISEMSRQLALSMCCEQLSRGGVSVWGARAEKHRGIAANMLEELLASPDGLKAETKTSAVLTFTTNPGTRDLATNEAKIPATTFLDCGKWPYVLADTVKVTSPADYTNMRNGLDFRVYWHHGFQCWVFASNVEEFTAAASPTVSFDWTYRRTHGMTARLSGKFSNAQ